MAEERPRIGLRYVLAFTALGVLILAATTGGTLLGLGFGFGWGFIALAVSTGFVGWLLGAD